MVAMKQKNNFLKFLEFLNVRVMEFISEMKRRINYVII